MNTILFFSILIGMAFAQLLLGRKASSESHSSEDYFLGGRSLGLFTLAVTILATQVGGGAILGAADEAYSRGWFAIFYSLGGTLGLLLLASGVGSSFRRMELSTTAEIFEAVYGSPFLRKIASVLSIASLFFILVAQGIATRKFLISLGFDSSLIFLLFWLVIITYTVMGGLKAVVSTDILQVAFIVLSFAIAFGSLWWNLAPSDRALDIDLFSSQESLPWSSWILMPLLFMLIEQDMGQRCFAAKSASIVSFASVLAAVSLLVLSLLPVYFGLLASNLGLSVPEGGSVLLTAVSTFTNPTVATFFNCAILMAIISTADSLINSVSSNLGCDFPVFSREGDEAKAVRTAKILTLVIGMASMALSFLFDNVVEMLVASYEMSVSVIFVPVTMSVILKKPPFMAAALSMLMGALGYLLFKVYAAPIPKEILTLLMAYIGYFIGMLQQNMSSKQKIS